MESNSFKVTTRKVMVGLLLMASACNSIALTLGRSHGTPVLGQPLALLFDVRLDTEDNVEAACIEAEVLQGDTRIDPSRVRVSGTPAGQVKVATTTVIEEPVVSVTLRAGCTQNTRRKYVLLTELAPELRSVAPAISAVPAALAAEPVVPGAIAASSVRPQALRPRVQPSARPVSTPRQGAQPRSRTARPGTKPTTARSQALAPRKPVSPPRASTPRLQLEPAELRSARNAGLRSSTGLTLPTAANPALRASAAAQWQALNSQLLQLPQAALTQDATRTEALEAQVGALQAAAALDRERTADVQKRLQLAEEARYANALVYTLLGLVLLALLALVYLWRAKNRQPATPPDWSNNQGQDAMGYGAATAADSWAAPLYSGLAPMTPDRVAVTPLDIDVDELLPWATPAPTPRTSAQGQASVQAETGVPTLPLAPVARDHVGSPYVRHAPHTAYDLDLDVDLSKPAAPITPLPPLPAGSGYSDLGDFDLFDPDTENDIAPKSTRR